MQRMGMTAILLALVAAAGCSMRVQGVVTDAETHGPIAGAAVIADDKRHRVAMTNQAGVYSLKTSSDTPSLSVSAVGYRTVTAPIPGGDRHADVPVALTPVESARRQPTITMVPVAPVMQRDTTSALEEVDNLYNRGMISPDEYRQMRARIVDGR
jgi:hypothetical protein